jgi:CubicO group peptidase (beta-lactamase class C family)
MEGRDGASTLDKLVKDVVKKRFIYGAVFYVSSSDGDIDLIDASGNMKVDSQYYIASINKLFISAVILRLTTSNKLDLADKISRFLPEEVVRRLHVYKGKDRSDDLSVLHLISQTSGLPCYLLDDQANGRRAMEDLETGIDQPWPFDKVIQEVKKMKAHFPPGKEGRARYGDTGHQLLSLIIEGITGRPIGVVLKNLFEELGMADTYVFDGPDAGHFVPIRHRSRKMHIPLYLASTQNDIISTAQDQMTFLKAFFEGRFFPKDRLKDLEMWNDIFFPFKYGIGIQQFHIPRILTPFNPVPDMVGHCGSTGSVAFYAPDLDLFITGTVNQQARPNIAFQTMVRILNKLG